jgi:hypothetical protein
MLFHDWPMTNSFQVLQCIYLGHRAELQHVVMTVSNFRNKCQKSSPLPSKTQFYLPQYSATMRTSPSATLGLPYDELFYIGPDSILLSSTIPNQPSTILPSTLAAMLIETSDSHFRSSRNRPDERQTLIMTLHFGETQTWEAVFRLPRSH